MNNKKGMNGQEYEEQCRYTNTERVFNYSSKLSSYSRKILLANLCSISLVSRFIRASQHSVE